MDPPERNESRGDSAGTFGAAGTRLWSQLTRVNSLARRIHSQADAEAVIAEVLALACDLTGARYGALAIFDRSQRILRFITHGMSDAEAAGIGDLPKGLGLLGLLQATPEPIRLNDIGRHAESYGFPPNHPPMHSFLGIPVRHGDETLGNLYLTEKEGGLPFNEEDEVILVLFVAQAAVAIHNSRLRDEARSRLVDAEMRSREMGLLHAVSQAAVSTSDLDRLLSETLAAIRIETGAEAAEAWLVEPGGASLRISARSGDTAGLDERSEFALGEGFAGEAAARLVPVATNDIATDTRLVRHAAIAAGFRGLHAYPMVFERQCIGVITLATRDPDRLDARVRQMLERAANELATAVRSIRLSRQVTDLAEERGQLLADARRERARFELLVEVSPAGVLIADAAGDLQIVNREARRILGIDTLPASVSALDLTHRYRRENGSACPAAKMPLNLAISTGEPSDAAEFYLIRPDGSETAVLVGAAPLVVDGRNDGAIGILQDINALVEQREIQASLDRYSARDAIARDLHDEIIQSVYAVGLGLRAVQRRDDVSKEDAIERATSDLNGVIADLRAYIHELSSVDAQASSVSMLRRRLEGLLTATAGDTQWSAVFEVDLDALPPRVERQLYLLAKEAISNVHRHAQAAHASLAIRGSASHLSVEVRDDGIGFDRRAVRPGAIGVNSIEQRVADLGGSLRIETEPGAGCRLRAEIPMDGLV